MSSYTFFEMELLILMKLITSDIRIRGVNKGQCLSFGAEEALKLKKGEKEKEKEGLKKKERKKGERKEKKENDGLKKRNKNKE